MKSNKVWYKRWYMIVLYVFVGLIIIHNFIPDEKTNNSDDEIFSELDNIYESSSEEPQSSSDLEEDAEEIQDTYLVTRIVDGDTIELDNGEKVRLICINTPEKGEYYYDEASDYLESLILNEEVELVKDKSETDRYGRLLRYVYLDEKFINREMVLKGYASAYPYSPDTTLCPQIEAAEEEAKNKNLGIWTQQEEEEESSSNSDIICSSNFYNCGDFSTCSEVMEVFNACSSDIHKLDADEDGIPCESLCNSG